MHAPRILKPVLYSFFTVVTAVGGFIFSQSIPQLRDKVNAEAPQNVSLGITESLDIDTAPDTSGYIKQLDQYRHGLDGDGERRNYRYLAEDQNVAAPDIDFGKVIGQVGNSYVQGMDPAASRKPMPSTIQGIDWTMGNPGLFRQTLQNARLNSTPQYALSPEHASVRGYFFVSDQSSVSCLTMQKNRRYDFQTGPTSGFYTLSPGGPGNPASTNEKPIYYRVGRGKTVFMHSANGNAVVLVETRIYFENVCGFGSNDSFEDDESLPSQRLRNVSFPIIAAITYNLASKKWTTVYLSQTMYKAAIIPVDNAGRYDALFWGASDTSLSLTESIRIHNPKGTKYSAVWDASYWRNNVPTFDSGGGGDRGGFRIHPIRDVYRSAVHLSTKYIVIKRSCSGTNCGFRSKIVFGSLDPVIKDGLLYIPVYPYWNPRDDDPHGFILKIRSADDVNNFAHESPQFEYRHRAYRNRDESRRCYAYDRNEANNTGFEAASGLYQHTVFETDNYSNNGIDTFFQNCFRGPMSELGFMNSNRVLLRTLGSGNYLLFDKSKSESGFSACDQGNTCLPLSNSQAYRFKTTGRSTPLNVAYMAGSFKDAETNAIYFADNAAADRLVYFGGEGVGDTPPCVVLPNGTCISDDGNPGSRVSTSEQSVIACNASDEFNPYKARFTIVSHSEVSTIRENFLYLAPQNSQKLNLTTTQPAGALSAVVDQTIHVAHGVANGTTDFSIFNHATATWGGRTENVTSRDSRQNIANNAAPFISTDRYTISNSSFRLAGKDAIWSFDLSLNRANPFYKQFLNTGVLDLYLLIVDASGNTNEVAYYGGKRQAPKIASISFDQFQQCGKVLFATTGGDFRSSERKYFREVSYGPETNKVWNVYKPFTEYVGRANENEKLDIPASSFMAEIIPASQVCNEALSSLYSRDSKFCFDKVNTTTGLTAEKALSTFAESIDYSFQSGGTMTKINPVERAISTLKYEYPASAFLAEGDSTLRIKTANIPGVFKTAYVYIPRQFSTIIIEDTVTPDSIENLIVWCRTPQCRMFIAPVSQVNQSSISVINGVISYPVQNPSLHTKGRVFLNYEFDERLTTPSQNPGGQFLTTPSGASIAVSDPRMILLDAQNASSNIYLGMMMTNGYIYSGRSDGTDVVKGGVVARGIATRDNGTNPSDPQRNKYMYFKDFSKPFLLIDFDAKYLLTFREIMFQLPKDVSRKFIGL